VVWGTETQEILPTKTTPSLYGVRGGRSARARAAQAGAHDQTSIFSLYKI
jgi:hypothetical protein